MAGTYDVTITYNVGCSASASVTVNNQGVTINPNGGSTNTTCGQSNGSAFVVPSGGSAPYSFLWDNGSTNDTIYNLANGNYSVTITDNNTCNTVATITVTDPTNFQASASSTDETCAGQCDGSITLQGSGGLTPLQYSIDGGLNYVASGNFLNLCSGSYNTMVKDANGCTIPNTVTILAGASVNNPVITPVSTLCNVGGNVFLQADILGGTWSGNGIVNTSTGEFSPSVAGIGFHTIAYAISGNNCSSTASIVVEVSNQIQLVIANQEICENVGLHTLSSVPLGGVWRGPALTDSLLGIVDVSLLAPDQYNYTYLMSQSCGDTAQMRLNVLLDEPITLDVDDSVCINEGIVSLITSNTGGTWSGMGVSSSQFSPVTAGIGQHTVYYTNPNLCQKSDSTTINVLNIPISSISIDQLKGCIPFTIHLNEANYIVKNVNWYLDGTLITSGADTTYTFLKEGIYTISNQIQDVFGCSQTSTFASPIEVRENPKAQFTAQPIDGTYEYYFTDQSTGANSILWTLDLHNYSLHEFKHTFQDTGTYNVCLYTENTLGCFDSTCQLIEIRMPYFNIYIPNAFTPNNNDLNDGFRPFLTDPNPQDYEFTIYNRWGEPIATLTNPSQSWDGTYLKQDCEQAVYTWKLKLKYADRYPIVMYGKVSLIK